MKNDEMWPKLPVASWKGTYETLHMLTQIVGKIRLATTPMENHWWNSTLYVTPAGLTTSVMYYNDVPFKIEFDLNKHFLIIEKAFDYEKKIPLESRPIADYYKDLMSTLESLGISLQIWSTPVEVENGIPFEKDYTHSTYDGDSANKFWRILTQSSRVFTKFRSSFIGKVSPVHFFWGAFDLAVTRFSGRKAPDHPGVPNCPQHVMVEAYSHEVSSCGLWFGGGPFDIQCIIRTHILNLRDSRMLRSNLQEPITKTVWVNLFCHMRMCGQTSHLINHYLVSFKVLMKLRPCRQSGNGTYWNEHESLILKHRPN